MTKQLTLQCVDLTTLEKAYKAQGKAFAKRWPWPKAMATDCVKRALEAHARALEKKEQEEKQNGRQTRLNYPD